MPLYFYEAADPDGNLFVGKVELKTEKQVAQFIQGRGLLVLHIKKINIWNKDLKDFSFFRQRVSIMDISIFCRLVSFMLDAGIPLLQTIDIIKNQSENLTLRKIAGGIYEDILKGISLSGSLSSYKEFPSFLTQMVKISELGSDLSSIMDKMANHYEAESHVKENIKTALIYPCLIFIMMLVVAFIAITYVIPNFANIFDGMKQELPLPTRMLLSFSYFFNRYYFFILSLIILVSVSIARFRKSKTGKRLFDKAALSIPIIKTFIQTLTASQFCDSLSILIHTGVPIINALSVVSNVVENEWAKDEINFFIKEILEGKDFSDVISQSKIFPDLLITMMNAGEKTGSLDIVVEKTSFYFKKKLERVITRFNKIFTPLLTVIVGIFIALLMLSIMLPLFSITSIL